MPIQMTCPGCQSRFRLVDDLAGKQVCCQKCRQMFVVPAPQPEDAPPVVATLVAPPPAQDEPAPPSRAEPAVVEEVMEATLAEPPPAAAPPRRRASLPPQSSGIAWAIVASGLFLLTLLGIGGLAVLWVATHLGPPSNAVAMPPRLANKDFKDGFIPGDDKPDGDRPFAQADKGKEMPRPLIAFDINDKYRKDDALTNNDPLDANLGHIRTYLIPLEAGLSYNIDLRSNVIDAYLTLYDPQGKVVSRDDDSGGNLNARILFDAKMTGHYRLLASDFKKGTGPYTLEITRFRLPISMAVHVPLPVQKKQQAGCEITETLPGRAPASADFFVWAADGQAFFMLHRDGVLRRYRYPEMIEEQTLALGNTTAHLHRCAAGLVVALPAIRELRVIDPQTLQITQRLPMVDGPTVFTAPTLAQVYSMANARSAIVRYDLAKHQVTVSGPLPAGVQLNTVTPEGRYLLGRDAANKLIRWRIDGDKYLPDETATGVFRVWPPNHPPIVVSPDSRLVLHPINNKLFPKSTFEPAPASDYGIAAYRVDDFRKPEFVLDTGPSNLAVAGDAKTGRIFTHCRTKGIIVSDPQGKVLRELPIEAKKVGVTNVWRLAVHPDGTKLAAFVGPITITKVLFIELPVDSPGGKNVP